MGFSKKLSIIIVNWNVKDLLIQCLTSIYKETRMPREDYEIIVVDNASADDSVEAVRSAFPEVVLLAKEDNLGFGRGCNAGYAVSKGEIIMLLNPDTVVTENGIDRMLEKFNGESRAGIMGFRLMNPDGSFQRASGGALPSLKNVVWNYLFLNRLFPDSCAPAPLFFEGDPEGTFEVGWVSGASMFVRREAVGDAIFDESFFLFGEDMDVCDQVRSRGWKVLYSGEVSIFHYHGRSYEKQSSVEVMETAIKGPRLFFKKYHGRMQVMLYDLILLAGYLIRWPAYGLLSLMKRGKDYKALSALSKRYVFIMVRLLRE